MALTNISNLRNKQQKLNMLNNYINYMKKILLVLLLTPLIILTGCTQNVITPPANNAIPTTIPTDPINGDLWLNTTTNEIGCYNGTTWNYYAPN